MSEIYDKTNIFKAYYGQVSEDARLAGVTDEVTLPNFENVSETLNLAGMVGEIDSQQVSIRVLRLTSHLHRCQKKLLELCVMTAHRLFLKAYRKSLIQRH